MTTTTSRSPAKDAVCAAAVDLARAVAEDVGAPDEVGEHLGSKPDGERIVTHYFTCLAPGYQGWQWAVTVTRAPRSKTVTVTESVLLPGEGALLSPTWVPWSERLEPGDLGVGDLLPTHVDDERLEPGYTQTDDEDADKVAVPELGLGRARVLSQIGRDDAADRWYSGDHGPHAPIAAAAPATCASCGFLMLMAGSLRRAFGVCANEYSPSDGRVVSVDHGCGAHSEAAVMPGSGQATGPLVDELGYDMVALRPTEHSPGSVADADPAEDLGHS